MTGSLSTNDAKNRLRFRKIFEIFETYSCCFCVVIRIEFEDWTSRGRILHMAKLLQAISNLRDSGLRNVYNWNLRKCKFCVISKWQFFKWLFTCWFRWWPRWVILESSFKFRGYIDVGDGCWRPNVLVKKFGRWWQVTSSISRVRHQHHH